jgi:uncharacterized protein (TIGR02996 family)
MKAPGNEKPTMCTAEAILADILPLAALDPEDDTPRLVYADWLEEHGGEAERARAEFIRIQIQRTSLEERDGRHAPLEARERQLLVANGRGWVGAEVQGLYCQLQFRRGFIERLMTRHFGDALWQYHLGEEASAWR